MSTPLYDKLIEYNKEKYPFHMPGHKFGRFGEMEKLNLSRLDATEASGLDNLYEAEGVIEEAMQLMANFYGAKETIFLTNGSTAGILASIVALCKPGDKFLVARNCHHSVWSALVLAGVQPIYISPNYRDKHGVIGEMDVNRIEEALIAYPEAKGVIIVSPTYEGIMSDIQQIASCVHERDKILIVDEAHGAHLILDSHFPMSSVYEGADLVIHSMHKTLPTLTQSALLHICSERINKEEIINALKMIQTSSPSYAMMGLMDYMRAYLESYRAVIKEEYIKPLIKVRKELGELKYLSILDENMNRYDSSKLIILTGKASINGYELATRLEQEYHLGVEAAQDNFIILMTTVADDKTSLERLKKALIKIDSTLTEGSMNLQAYQHIYEGYTLGNSPREIYFEDKQWISLEKSVGQVSGKNIMLYPPGIPIICIGEQIQQHHLEVIKLAGNTIKGIRIEDDEIQLYISKETIKS